MTHTRDPADPLRALVWARLCACLVLSGMIAWAVLTPPSPRSADAPAEVFSAARAMSDVEVIAREPHPTGSDANRAVRDYLFGRMIELGLAPVIQPATATLRDGSDLQLENIIGVMPGADPHAPALALMAHYDSTTRGPGAGDDASGVAAILEIVRALKSGAPPERDILVVLTDAEEPGLLGAQAFFDDNPEAGRIGFVINLEARGSRGRAMMFETTPGNGETVRMFASSAPRPLSNSLMVYVYERMPNGTDFTIAKARGVQGLNFAYLGAPVDYHAATDTPGNLSRGSVQDLGDQALAAARAVTGGPLPGAAPDVVYSDVFGLMLIAYPDWGGWLVLGLSGALFAVGVARARRMSGAVAKDMLRGLWASLLLLVLCISAGFLGQSALAVLDAPVLAWLAPIEAVAMATGVILLLLWPIRIGRGRPGVWSGVIAPTFLFGIAAQALAPATTPVLHWPLLLACAASAICASGAARGWQALAATALLVPGLAFLAAFAHLTLLALLSPLAIAPWVWLGAMLIWPLASPVRAPAR